MTALLFMLCVYSVVVVCPTAAEIGTARQLSFDTLDIPSEDSAHLRSIVRNSATSTDSGATIRPESECRYLHTLHRSTDFH